jgi:hypothetical protein
MARIWPACCATDGKELPDRHQLSACFAHSKKSGWYCFQFGKILLLALQTAKYQRRKKGGVGMIGLVIWSVALAALVGSTVIMTGGSAVLALLAYAAAGSMSLILLATVRGSVAGQETTDRDVHR